MPETILVAGQKSKKKKKTAILEDRNNHTNACIISDLEEKQEAIQENFREFLGQIL